MKHTIRQNGQITQIDCEIGSGLFDKNGIEIIEGDIVSNGRENLPVKFINGALMIFSERNGEGYDINSYFARGFEVVGHAED